MGHAEAAQTATPNTFAEEVAEETSTLTPTTTQTRGRGRRRRRLPELPELPEPDEEDDPYALDDPALGSEIMEFDLDPFGEIDEELSGRFEL